MDSILHGPSAKHEDRMRLSLSEFSTITQSHLTDLSKAQQSLQWVSFPFKEEGAIRPVHCKIALESLDKASEHVRELFGLLYETSSLPVVMTALRYQLLLILHRVEEQMDKLVDLVNSYRLICITSSQHTLQQRKEIYSSFEKLLQYLTDISQEAKLLYDEGKFQERKITAKLEEQPSTENPSNGNPASHKRLFIVKNENGIDVL
jgi:hypothetical protein